VLVGNMAQSGSFEELADKVSVLVRRTALGSMVLGQVGKKAQGSLVVLVGTTALGNRVLGQVGKSAQDSFVVLVCRKALLGKFEELVDSMVASWLLLELVCKMTLLCSCGRNFLV
jgi:hypothetical protein